MEAVKRNFPMITGLTAESPESKRLRVAKERVIKAAVKWFNSDRRMMDHDEMEVKLIDRIIEYEAIVSKGKRPK